VYKTNFVSEQLAQNFSDVVYKCRLLDKKTYLYFILESQTGPDFYFPHRIEKYRLSITDEHLKTEKFLPRIYTICLYSSNRPFKILDYANPKLNALFNSSGVNLIHLRQQQDALLTESGIFQVLLKLGSQRKGREKVLDWIQTHQDYVTKLLESPYKYTGVSYLWALEKRNNPSMVLENFVNLFPKYKREIMNVVQQLKQEGRKEGRKEGRLKGRQEERFSIAKSMLKEGIAPTIIKKITGLNEENLKKSIHIINCLLTLSRSYT
jgi:hypothetical protein